MNLNTNNVQTDQYIILSLINVSDNLKNTIENFNKQMDMSNAQNRLIPQVYVKNIFENCKSALDYMTFLIVKTYQIPVADRNIKFPVYKTEINFEKSQIIETIKIKNPILYEIVKKAQPFTGKQEYNWLEIFNELNNKYKHQGFIPLQARFATEGGGWVSMSANASLGMFTMNLTNEANGELTINTTDFQGNRNVPFSFVFENNEELIPFLHKVISGVYSIINEIWSNGPKKNVDN